MQKEIWKYIPGYDEKYQVSNFGRVKSLIFKNERILKNAVDSTGYHVVSLSKKNSTKKQNVHKLVCISFLEHNPCGYKLVINHKNSNRIDNRLDNLEIITQRQNTNKSNLKHTSIYVGVHWCKDKLKWRAQFYHENKNIHLGYFKDENDANIAYQNKLKSLE